MTLKERMEAVWENPHIASPNHLNRWNETGTGYTFFGKTGLYWTRGKQLGPKKKVKGKGFSFLPKNYGMAYWFREANK